MSDQGNERDLSRGTDDELDTEGQAFKWELVDEKGKARLHQSWTPDEPIPRPERWRGAKGDRKPEEAALERGA